MHDSSFERKIRSLRGAKGGAICGVARSHFGHILKGGDKSKQKLRKIARFFMVSLQFRKGEVC